MVNRVFVIAPDPRFDTKDLERYGERVYIFPWGCSNPFNTEVITTRVREAMADYKYDSDYFALTGNAASLAIVAMIAFYGTGCLRLLIFDARTATYRLRILDGEE